MKAYIRYQGLQRVEEYLFPEPALREALLNAVIHKDYGSSIPIQISVYEDKIMSWNSGFLPQDWTVERLMGKHPSIPYNPLLANAFFRAGYVESWGRGIEKINRECEEYGAPPPIFDYDASGLMLTIKADPIRAKAILGEKVGNSIGENFGENFGENLSEHQKKILELLRHDPRMTARELASQVGITARGIELNIAKLKDLGFLTRIGASKGGYWEVLK